MVPANSSDSHTWYDAHNQFISDDYLLASTVRFGMEYRVTSQLYGRLGYAWMQNAMTSHTRRVVIPRSLGLIASSEWKAMRIGSRVG